MKSINNNLLQLNRLVPIVRNLYQARKQILWGFMNSLISKELLFQFNWTGQGNPKKKSFEKMKQIQSILWCAMLKVSPTYSVKEFEADLKTNLTKCAAQIKDENGKNRERAQEDIFEETNENISKEKDDDLNQEKSDDSLVMKQ